MTSVRKYMTIGVTVAAAAGTAHVMQSGTSGPTQASVIPGAVAPVPTELAGDDGVAMVGTPPGSDEASTIELDVPQSVDVAGGPVLPDDVTMPDPLVIIGPELAARVALNEVEMKLPSLDTEQRNRFGLACGPELSLTRRDLAMVGLSVTAPCRAEETISVRHGVLEFDARLDAFGRFSVDVPAFVADAAYDVVFADAVTLTDAIEIPGAEAFDRVGLIYRGPSGLQIHALEFGATYDEEGHVWLNAPRDAATAVVRGGGFLTYLGDPEIEDGMTAQIYTFPSSELDRLGTVRLSVETEITALNCDLTVSGRILERPLGGDMTAISVEVATPDCSAVGEYLVLKNLLRDMKIALNE